MTILFLCGYYENDVETEIIQNAKAPIEYSANIFQKKMIEGFRKLSFEKYDFSILSAPFVGCYPNASKLITFKTFPVSKDCQYVGFLNIWGFRNLSRAHALKKALNKFIDLCDKEKRIVIYSIHTPFLEAALYAKKKDPYIKICLIVPDLPQYMNLNAHVSILYKIGKKVDIWHFRKMNKDVDSYVLLTEQMKNKIDTLDKRTIIVEGILEDDFLKRSFNNVKTQSITKYIVYTGKMSQKYGVKNLIDAFKKIPDTNYRLVLCGRGELDSYIKQCTNNDSRIIAVGQVSPEESREWQHKADVLVNPRQNNEEYAKYSFPSKNLEYLTVGVPVVAHNLSGMPAVYKDFVFCIGEDGNEIDAIGASIKEALSCPDCSLKYNAFIEYAMRNLTASGVIKRMLEKVI